MKSETSNKDNSYSLQNNENYKNEINFNINDAIQNYSQLVIEYFKFIMENIKIKNINLLKFIIIRGLDTITNVFLYIIFFTKNVDLTYFHSQKSYYFYVEFVSQISDDEKMFLQLTSRDATNYVYKKTIFDINNEFKKMNENVSEEFKSKMNIIKSYINLYQTYIIKIIQTKNIDANNITHLVKLSEKLNNFTNKSKINILENIIEKLYSKIENIELFFEINHLLVKQFIKNSKGIKLNEEKINSEDFNDNLNELSRNKFIIWFLS
jgi:hypothetical protein